MTDSTTEPTPPADEPAEQPVDPDTAADPTDDDQPTQDTPTESEPSDTGTGNSEAARRRREVRDLKRQRQDLAGRIEKMQLADVSRIAERRMADPADLYREVNLPDLLNDDGDVDDKLVDLLIDSVLAHHPHWAKIRPPVTPPASNVTGDGRPPEAGESQPTWKDLLGGSAG